MRRMVLLVAIALLQVACGGSGDTASTPTTTEAPAPEESGSVSAYAGYEIPEFERSTCYRTARLGSKTSVTLTVKSDVTAAYPWVPNCLTDVKAKRVRIKVVGDESVHSLVMQGTDTEMTIPPGKTVTETFDLADQKVIYFACTFHPSMAGAFFR